jgi:hypothetical protein
MMLGEDWREAYIDFIQDQRLPAGIDARSAEVARVMRRSKGFVLVDSKLYRRGARSGVLMKCVTKEDGYDILQEIHKGVCGNHAAWRTLVGKAYRAGFWWPTAVSDAEDLMPRCQNCQRLRRFAHDKHEAIKRKIAKLLTAGFIKEVNHPEWVASPVLVRKKNNEWRMCVDYTDLNKHCPKDHFRLPRIDQVVDSTAGCVLLWFLDCYSGYHQIALKEEDQIKTTFITPFGTYAYKIMSFGLKNAGATYQRAIQMCFANQLHRNIEAYVEDMVIKTRHPKGLIADLEETFSSLRRFRWKLNLTKCVFGVPSGKLLRFIISNRGIEANPVKILAITDMGAPVWQFMYL